MRKLRGKKIELLELNLRLYQMKTMKAPVQQGGPDHKGSNLGNFNLGLGSNPRYATNHLQDPGDVTKSQAAQDNG